MNNKLKTIIEYKFGNINTTIVDIDFYNSMSFLHPVAMQVCKELTEKQSNKLWKGRKERDQAGVKRTWIQRSCAAEPVNGEYVDLLNDVYHGIVFLNNQK